MDLIFLLVITPITIAVMFVYWKLKQYFRDFDKLPEASPYEFERDNYIPEFDTYTKAIYKHKFYKGKNK
jgi:hypothetical protein